MSPADFQRDVVDARLRLISDLLSEIGEAVPVDIPTLRKSPLLRLAFERAFTQVVDLAVDINTHVSVSLLRKAPGGYRASFRLAAEAGMLDADLAERLADAAGLRNVLIHRYTEVDLTRFAEACNRFTSDFAEYVRRVAAFEP